MRPSGLMGRTDCARIMLARAVGGTALSVREGCQCVCVGGVEGECVRELGEGTDLPMLSDMGSPMMVEVQT